ncbi:MAG: DNA adenine methylase [Sphaerochaetaceae bacterium]|nr:DNA adenine methylase [Sphaerochaetaceae bacterium]
MKQRHEQVKFPSYESDQVLSVIRGKRQVLSVLKEVIAQQAKEIGAQNFLDPFAGSGVVSRAARDLGLTVWANDIEPFACVNTSVYLTLSQEDLSTMFPSQGGIDAYYSFINLHGLYASHSRYAEGAAYLSRLYSPEDAMNVKEGRERLYFTRENALFIDAVREEIENSYTTGAITTAEKAVVLSSLLYQASVKANVSGTYTSYHKRFYRSGTSQPVRSRIIEPLNLTVPYLIDSRYPRGFVHNEDAISFLKRTEGDICFLDPPSSDQQYGSAYHLLNTIALYSDPKVDTLLDAEGQLVDKGGIRSDWRHRRSPFCSRKDAYGAFHALINAVDSQRLILTYPDNALVSTEQILEMLNRKYSNVSLTVLPRQVKGGRQAKGTVHVEQLFIAGSAPLKYLSTGDALEKLKCVRQIEALRDRVFRGAEGGIDGFSFIEGSLMAAHPSYEEYTTYTLQQLTQMAQGLNERVIPDSSEALGYLMELYISSFSKLRSDERVKMEKKLISLLRFIHGYEKERFDHIIALMRQIYQDHEQLLSSRTTLSGELKRFFLLSQENTHSGDSL